VSGPASQSGLYNSRWRKLRRLFLDTHPLCAMCKQEGRIKVADELDHIEKHNGNPELFWNWDNLQGLCRYHHRSVKARIERSGEYGCDTDGLPNDPRHHWR